MDTELYKKQVKEQMEGTNTKATLRSSTRVDSYAKQMVPRPTFGMLES